MKREGRIHKGVSIGAYSILIAFMLLLLWTVLRYPGNHLIHGRWLWGWRLLQCCCWRPVRHGIKYIR